MNEIYLLSDSDSIEDLYLNHYACITDYDEDLENFLIEREWSFNSRKVIKKSILKERLNETKIRLTFKYRDGRYLRIGVRYAFVVRKFISKEEQKRS